MRELDALFEKYETLLLRKGALIKEVTALKAVRQVSSSAEATEMKRDIEKILG